MFFFGNIHFFLSAPCYLKMFLRLFNKYLFLYCFQDIICHFTPGPGSNLPGLLAFGGQGVHLTFAAGNNLAKQTYQTGFRKFFQHRVKAAFRGGAAAVGELSYLFGYFITVQGLPVQHVKNKKTGKAHFNQAGPVFLRFVPYCKNLLSLNT
jgi:hypothetical protein